MTTPSTKKAFEKPAYYITGLLESLGTKYFTKSYRLCSVDLCTQKVFELMLYLLIYFCGIRSMG